MQKKLLFKSQDRQILHGTNSLKVLPRCEQRTQQNVVKFEPQPLRIYISCWTHEKCKKNHFLIHRLCSFSWFWKQLIFYVREKSTRNDMTSNLNQSMFKHTLVVRRTKNAGPTAYIFSLRDSSAGQFVGRLRESTERLRESCGRLAGQCCLAGQFCAWVKTRSAPFSVQRPALPHVDFNAIMGAFMMKF